MRNCTLALAMLAALLAVAGSALAEPPSGAEAALQEQIKAQQEQIEDLRRQLQASAEELAQMTMAAQKLEAELVRSKHIIQQLQHGHVVGDADDAEEPGGPFFTNVASAAGVNNSGSGNAAAWFDCDNDGDMDLYVVNDPGSGGFYRNNGDGTFESVSIGLSGHGNWVAAADYDKDGWTDVVLGSSDTDAILYRNAGDGTFADATASAGIDVGHCTLVVWGDFNNDTWPDLYFAGSAKKLYRNSGDGTFTDVTSMVPAISTEGCAAAWVDCDNDGCDDLFIAENGGTVRLFRYSPFMATFESVSAVAAMNLSTSGHRLAVGDYDNNGYVDVFVFGGGADNYLLKNMGYGMFEEVAQGAGVKNTDDRGYNGGAAFLDFDQDGDLDLFADGGRYGGNNFFRNNGNGTFEDITAATGLANTDDSHAIAVGDFNGDGYPDIYEVNFTGYRSSANKLFRNNVAGSGESD